MDIPLLNGRLKEFFAHEVPWHRRLWSVGTILGLREVGEYVDACLNEEVASTEGLRYVIEASRRAVGRDPGVAHLAVELDRLLDLLSVQSRTKIPRDARDELSELSRRAHDEYCGHWRGAPEVPLEFAARSLAAHLLDSGFSADHLFRWLTARESSLASRDDLADETQRMVTDMPERPHEIFVPCAAPFDKPNRGSGTVRWMDGHEASAWLKSQLTVPETRRHNGGFQPGPFVPSVLTDRERDLIHEFRRGYPSSAAIVGNLVRSIERVWVGGDSISAPAAFAEQTWELAPEGFVPANIPRMRLSTQPLGSADGWGTTARLATPNVGYCDPATSDSATRPPPPPHFAALTIPSDSLGAPGVGPDRRTTRGAGTWRSIYRS